jgi:hypothetical protein
MKRRSGVTLVEVLVAIFVMALGLLTLLALFPLGVLTMEQAIQDDRTATASETATAIAIAQDLRHDPSVMPLFQTPPPASIVYTAPLADGPSYPVYVDPAGYRSYLSPTWVGGGTYGVPRSTVSFVNTPADVLRWFSLLDDIQFDDSGYPNYPIPGQPTTFERNNRYGWAYLLRRPMTGDPTVVDMAVVVYAQRSLQSDETTFNASFDPTSNIVSVSWPAGSPPPNLRPGSWILDTTPVATSPTTYGPPHASFYRVVGATDTSATSMDLEVQTPLRAFPAAGGPFGGTIVVMEGVAEVFEKGTGWHP